MVKTVECDNGTYSGKFNSKGERRGEGIYTFPDGRKEKRSCNKGVPESS